MKVVIDMRMIEMKSEVIYKVSGSASPPAMMSSMERDSWLVIRITESCRDFSVSRDGTAFVRRVCQARTF